LHEIPSLKKTVSKSFNFFLAKQCLTSFSKSILGQLIIKIGKSNLAL